MTKEELKKEAQEQVNYHTPLYIEDFIHGYLVSAEPREKRIAELEEELAISEHDREHNDYELTEVYKKVAELEKENAELKELKKKKEEIEIMIEFCKTCKQMHTDQLTKAKELLERLLITSCNSDVLNLLPNCSEVLRVRVEAEQFLSEVEK